MKFWKIGIGGFILWISTCFALNVPAYQGFVTDNADIFSPEERQQLETQLQQIEQQTTAEIAVLTVKSTDGEDIAQFATEVGQSWGVGKEDKDNGALMVIAVDDRQWFIATGYGTEGVLPDLLAKQIGEKYFPVNFREGKYFDGVSAAITDMGNLIGGDETLRSMYASETSPEISQQTLNTVVGFFIFFLFLTMILRKWVHKDQNLRGKRSTLSALGLSAIASMILFFLFFSFLVFFFFPFFFLLFFLFLFPVQNNAFFFGGPWNNRGGFGGGGGGFGGFGGGGFGGGGSGGRW